MVLIAEPKHKCIGCNVCASHDDPKEITIRYMYMNQGVAIVLCRNCRKELIDKIKETIQENNE